MILETNKFDKENATSYIFEDPEKTIKCYKISQVKRCLKKIDKQRGKYLAGFISYEAGYAFEKAFKDKKKAKYDFPLIWFGVYKNPGVIRHEKGIEIIEYGEGEAKISNLRPNIKYSKYEEIIKKIKEEIEKGNTYQVNYTYKYKFNYDGKLEQVYNELKRNQSVSYSAYINTDEFAVISMSPELFFRKTGNNIEVKPMKGTSKAESRENETEKNIKWLKNSQKNRSENVMIVDLLRNDLGRIAKSSSVVTKKLFEVEKYETVLQMVSTVKAKLKDKVKYYDLFKTLFPSGSVTGAPKISTMKIIDKLEAEPRKLYTGCIGFISPKDKSVFNVAIRTIIYDKNRKTGEMGIGSGIVYDSEPKSEYKECELKAKFMLEMKDEFCLFETMLWNGGYGYFLLKEHMERIERSAKYFGFKFNREELMDKLIEEKRKMDIKCKYKIKIILSKNGEINTKKEKIFIEKKEQYKIVFSKRVIDSKNMFFRHKTTKRKMYNNEYKKYNKLGYDDVIFMNERKEITEGAISNIIVKIKGKYYTPPVECGLLPGTYREHLMNAGELKAKILHEGDLRRAEKIYIVNSVQGVREVKLEE